MLTKILNFNIWSDVMKVSTKGRYGLRAMIELAENNKEGPVPLREISENQDISEQYLEQIFVKLRKKELVKSVRGAYGGYLLKKTPSEICIGDIIRALEGPIAPSDCLLEEESCSSSGGCVARILWKKVRDSINEVLDSMTLEELKNEANNLY